MIQDVISQIQASVLTIPGIQSAPVTVPEAPGGFPFCCSYPRKGSLKTEGAGWAHSFHTIFTEIHVSRQLLSLSVMTAIGFLDPFFKILIADPTLAGTVSTIQDIRYTFGKLEWAGIETIGIRFELDVKMNLEVS